MAGINDVCFRSLCIECGAQLSYTEMISSKGLDYKNDKTINLLTLAKNENKVVVQLFGHEPKVMARQAIFVKQNLGNKLAYIDINMGCPAKKIVKKGDGSALMDNPKLAAEIVRKCSKEVTTTVKIRNHKNVVDYAKLMEKSGASAICIHPRFQSQFYRGNADWEVVKKIKNVLTIPIIGSGDIKSYDEAKSKLDVCDAVMIGRGALGNPYVFSSDNFTNKDRINLGKRHLIEYDKLNRTKLSYMRKHCMWYVRGCKNATWARAKFSKCNNLDEFLEVFNKIEA